jgi:amino acid transporter
MGRKGGQDDFGNSAADGGVAVSRGVFLREATGLVREMNTFDVVAMNSFNISAGLGLAFVLYVAPTVFFNAGPNGIPLGVLLATLGGLSGALTFAILTAMVPRSVGDYVLVTRTFHPALGFATNWTWAFWNIVWAGILTSFITNWALYDLFSIYGTMYDVQWMRDTAFGTDAFLTLYPPSSGLNILLGTLIIAAFGVLLSVGPKAFLYFQRAVFSIGLFSLIVALGVMATATNAQFIANWDAYAAVWQTNPADYNTIATGPYVGGVPTYVAWLAILGVVPVASWSLAYGQATTALGGEIKRPNRNLPIGAALSVLIAGSVMALGAFLFIRVVGLDFLSGSGNAYFATLGSNPDAASPWYFFYPPPFFDLWVSIIAQNPIITLIIGIGFIAWILYYPGLDCLMNTRALLSWSFDRIMPGGLGKVSDRFHTPIRAVMLFSFLNWIALVVFSLNFSLVGSLTATLAVFLTMFLVMGLVGLVFPFARRTKPIFEASPIKWKVGRLPVLTIVSVGWLIFLFTGIFFYLSENSLASNRPIMLIMSVVIFIAAFPIYYIAKAVRKGQGIDIGLAFKEIPPE